MRSGLSDPGSVPGNYDLNEAFCVIADPQSHVFFSHAS